MMHSLLACLGLLLLAAPDDAEKTRALVEKAVRAHGGQDALLRTFRWKERYFIGDSKNGTERSANLVPPDAWWQGKTNIADGNPDRGEKTYLVWAWTLVPLLDKDSRLALLPGETVDGKPAAGLLLRRDKRPDLSLYFDVESGRLARIDWRAYRITFADWKEADGARYPSQAFVRRKDGSLHLRTEFLELERVKAAPAHQTRVIEGWTLKIHEALLASEKEATEKAVGLLTAQLQEIVRVVPAPAVAKLRGVTLWFSPPYPGVKPGAEYHPGRDWLERNKRNPDMVKGVEFTDIRDFEAETRRMPNFTLHELAHGYHDRVLGFNHPEIKAAYNRAKASKSYDAVERWFGNGRPNTTEKAYAMTSPQEYFAESTEAFFARNDFFPFNREELRRHDPAMERLLERLWSPLPPPPAALKVPAFYTQYLEAGGYPIVASAKVSEFALREAAYLADLMLAKRPDVRAAMIKSGSRLCIIAHDEFTTDLPEWSHLKPKDHWDARARGMGGSRTDPLCSCGEENLLAYTGDPYAAESIFIHEFAHNIHLRGMVNVDAAFDDRVKAAYEAAIKAGLWKGKYAAVNHHEYFAEGVQSWFDDNRENDHDHNHVNTRTELLEYDPGLAALCREVFGDTELKYTKPATRLRDHLAGYDPSLAPRFAWPERLKKAREEIRAKVAERVRAAEGAAPPPSKP